MSLISKKTEYEVCTTAGMSCGDCEVTLRTYDEDAANAELNRLEARYPNSSHWIYKRDYWVASDEMRQAMLTLDNQARKDGAK